MLTDADVVLLTLLTETPRHGYDLDKVIAERGYRRWTSVAFSSVYSVLKRLAERGLIAPAAGSGTGRRAVYDVTPLGAERLRAAVALRVGEPDPPSAGVLPALGAFATPDDPELLALLADRAASLLTHLQQLRTAREMTGHPIADAIFGFEIARHEAELAWTSDLIAGRTPEDRP